MKRLEEELLEYANDRGYLGSLCAEAADRIKRQDARIIELRKKMSKLKARLRVAHPIDLTAYIQEECAKESAQLLEVLEMIAAQGSGVPGSTSRADCMAALAQAVIRKQD